MNEWLNDIVAELKQSKADRQAQDARLQIIGQQVSRIFEDLKPFLRDAAEKMRADADIKARVGELECHFNYVQHLEINRKMIPGVFVTVSYGPTSIDIKWRLYPDQSVTNVRETKESLLVDLDSNGQPYLKNKDGEPLLLDEAVGFILKPMIFPDLLGKPEKGRVGTRWA